MNILVITGTYGKIMSPESGCIDKYIQVLKHRHSITIICPKAEHNYNSIEGVEIRPVSDFWNDCRVTSSSFAKKTCGFKRLFWSCVLFVVRLRGYLLSFWAFPTRNRWLINAYENEIIRVSHEKAFNVIFSVAGLPCAHISARKYKKDNPSVKWLTFTYDPFSKDPDVYKHVIFKSGRKTRNKCLEESYFNAADKNFFSEELYNVAVSVLDIPPSKCLIAPYTLSPIRDNYKGNVTYDHPLRIVYAGSLYKDIRNPQIALSVLSRIESIEVYFYTAGNCDGIINDFTNKNVFLNPKLPKDDYYRVLTQESDVLLNISNASTLMSPSKLYELVSTGKPILNFYFYKDSSYKIVEKYPLGLNVGPEDKDVKVILEFLNRVKGERLSFSDILNIYPDNCIDTQVKIVESLFNGNYDN